MSNAYHPVVHTIVTILTQAGVRFSRFDHEPVRTSLEAHQVRPGFRLEQGAKALILKLYPKQGEPYFAQCVIPAHLQLDARSVCRELDLKRLRFATQGESDQITNGIEFGGIPPFGNLFNIPVYADQAILTCKIIIFNAGDRRVSIALESADWVHIVHPKFCKIAK